MQAGPSYGKPARATTTKCIALKNLSTTSIIYSKDSCTFQDHHVARWVAEIVKTLYVQNRVEYCLRSCSNLSKSAKYGNQLHSRRVWEATSLQSQSREVYGQLQPRCTYCLFSPCIVDCYEYQRYITTLLCIIPKTWPVCKRQKSFCIQTSATHMLALS